MHERVWEDVRFLAFCLYKSNLTGIHEIHSLFSSKWSLNAAVMAPRAGERPAELLSAGQLSASAVVRPHFDFAILILLNLGDAKSSFEFIGNPVLPSLLCLTKTILLGPTHKDPTAFH
jgi:hypothetical protein